MRLFHFSEHGDIARFVPRAVRVASPRAPGREWLNGPLVWAIDDWHQPMYLFPRDCPRILSWATSGTTEADRAAHCGDRRYRMVAHIEARSADALRSARLFRYALPPAEFEPLGDAGMWVSHGPVAPLAVDALQDLSAALAAAGVDLRIHDSLVPLRALWQCSLHVSGIRLRNAVGWSPVAESEQLRASLQPL